MHFSWRSDPLCAVLKVNDTDASSFYSKQSEGFANIIGYFFALDDFDNISIYLPSQKQVNMLESNLREIGYEFKNGEMKKIDGNKA